MGIFWVPKDTQKIGCKSAGWPSYLFGADMGSSSTRDGFAILKFEKNWCVVHIPLKWDEFYSANNASLGESKLFSRFL